MAGQDRELDELRDRVNCCTVLEVARWHLDQAESSRNSPKYRNGGSGVIVVRYAGRGWFDPLGGRKGDVIALAQYLWCLNIGQARARLRPLAGIEPKFAPLARYEPRATLLDAGVEWRKGHLLRPGSRGWRYLTETRRLPAETVRRASEANNLREGVCGTVWAPHCCDKGKLLGWEMRGPEYKGYLRDGRKSLYGIGAHRPTRVAATESFIDAMSLATLESWRSGTRYVSTGGGWTEAGTNLLRAFLIQGAVLVAATDQGVGGNLMADRLCEIARTAGAPFERLIPGAKDWNAQLHPTGTKERADESRCDLAGHQSPISKE